LVLHFPSVETQLGINSLQGAFLASLGLLGYIPGSLLIGQLSYKIGRRLGLLLTASLTSIGSIGDALAQSYSVFAIFRFITGMSIGGDLNLAAIYILVKLLRQLKEEFIWP